MTTLTSWLVYPILRKYLSIRKWVGEPRLLVWNQQNIPDIIIEEEYDD